MSFNDNFEVPGSISSHSLTPAEDPSTSAKFTTNESPGAHSWVDGIARLIQEQNDIMREVLAESKQSLERSSFTTDIRDVLRVLHKMNERQAATESISRQPLPRVPATSASAWTPLLRSHLANTQPVVDRWRGTLDTILVFIALFSAVVSTLFVQSLAGLSPDPGSRTNELLVNLTNIVLLLSTANTTQLNLPAPAPFVPDAAIVRLNLYWSISLVVSISIAALAVTCRGYVTMVNRSQQERPHKKLGELHRRWVEANRLLAPAIQTFPQLLILPVALLILGLVDLLLSNSLPVSGPLIPILVSGIISGVFVAAAAGYILWTAIHGLVYPSLSPFQSTLLRTISQSVILWMTSTRRAHIARILGHIYKSIFGFSRRQLIRLRMLICFRPLPSIAHPTVRSDIEIGPMAPGAPQIALDSELGKRRSTKAVLDEHEIAAFHAALFQANDDDALDQSTAALADLLRLDISRNNATLISAQGMRSLTLLISPEASIRSNLTASAAIDVLYDIGFHEGYKDLMMPLIEAAGRYSTSASSQNGSAMLWCSPFMTALCLLCRPPNLLSHGALFKRDHDELARRAPVLGLLLMDHDSWSTGSDLELMRYRYAILSLTIAVLNAKFNPRYEGHGIRVLNPDIVESSMRSQSKEVLEAVRAVLSRSGLHTPSHLASSRVVYAGLAAIFSHGFFIARFSDSIGDRLKNISLSYKLATIARTIMHWPGREGPMPPSMLSRSLRGLIPLYAQHAMDHRSFAVHEMMCQWLGTIWHGIDTTLSLFFNDLIHRDSSDATDYLQTILEIVQFSAGWEIFEDPPTTREYSHPLRQRHSFFAFDTLSEQVVKSLSLVRRWNISLRLDSQAWDALKARFEATDPFPLLNPGQEWSRVISERQICRQSVFKAFRPFQPGYPEIWNEAPFEIHWPWLEADEGSVLPHLEGV